MRSFMKKPVLSLVILLSLSLVWLAGCGAESPPEDPAPTQAGSDQPGETPAGSTPMPGRDMEDYFGGETITIAVGFSPGGGYDIFSRLVAQYAPRYLPGEPEMVVQNMPGGGGEQGLRRSMIADPDGLTIGILHPRFVQRELLGIDVPEFDLRTVNFIGAPAATESAGILYSRTDVASTWDEVLGLGREITAGQVEPGAAGGEGPRFMELIGGPVRMVYGYGGSSEIMAAIDRGELDSSTDGVNAVERLYPEWIENQTIAPILRWGTDPDNDPVASQFIEWFGGVTPPHIFDAYEATDGQRAAFQLAFAMANDMGRTFVLAPDVPDDIVAVWQDVFQQITSDPEFIEAAELAGYEVGYFSPQDIDTMLEDGLTALEDPEVNDLFVDLVGPAQ